MMSPRGEISGALRWPRGGRASPKRRARSSLCSCWVNRSPGPHSLCRPGATSGLCTSEVLMDQRGDPLGLESWPTPSASVPDWITVVNADDPWLLSHLFGIMGVWPAVEGTLGVSGGCQVDDIKRHIGGTGKGIQHRSLLSLRPTPLPGWQRWRSMSGEGTGSIRHMAAPCCGTGQPHGSPVPRTSRRSHASLWRAF